MHILRHLRKCASNPARMNRDSLIQQKICFISKFTCMFKFEHISMLCKSVDMSMPAFGCFFSLFFSTASPRMLCLPDTLQHMLCKIENKPHWLLQSVKMWIHRCGRLFRESQICAGSL